MQNKYKYHKQASSIPVGDALLSYIENYKANDINDYERLGDTLITDYIRKRKEAEELLKNKEKAKQNKSLVSNLKFLFRDPTKDLDEKVKSADKYKKLFHQWRSLQQGGHPSVNKAFIQKLVNILSKKHNFDYTNGNAETLIRSRFGGTPAYAGEINEPESKLDALISKVYDIDDTAIDADPKDKKFLKKYKKNLVEILLDAQALTPNKKLLRLQKNWDDPDYTNKNYLGD